MGNCFKKQLVIEDSLRLIDHNYDIVHDIETLKEDMNKTNNNISSLNTSTNNNFDETPAGHNHNYIQLRKAIKTENCDFICKPNFPLHGFILWSIALGACMYP